jgi:hypothetical protein
MTQAEIEGLQAAARGCAGSNPWWSSGEEVFCGSERVGRMEDRAAATHVVELHNRFLPLFNSWVRMVKRVKDLRKVLEVSRGI